MAPILKEPATYQPICSQSGVLNRSDPLRGLATKTLVRRLRNDHVCGPNRDSGLILPWPNQRGTMITQQLRKSSLLAALMATALLAGCGGGHKAVSRRTDAAKPGSTSPTRAMKFQLAADSTGHVNAEVPSQPIGSTPTSINGIALQLYLAKRQSTGAVLVVFALQMDASARSHLNSESVPLGLSANADPQSGGSLINASVSGVALLDPAGLKKYETYMSNPSDDATCLCSLVGPGTSGSGVAGASATTSYYAALVAAPPPSVTSVSFVTGLGTIGNVTLSG